MPPPPILHPTTRTAPNNSKNRSRPMTLQFGTDTTDFEWAPKGTTETLPGKIQRACDNRLRPTANSRQMVIGWPSTLGGWTVDPQRLWVNRRRGCGSWQSCTPGGGGGGSEGGWVGGCPSLPLPSGPAAIEGKGPKRNFMAQTDWRQRKILIFPKAGSKIWPNGGINGRFP